MKINLSWMSFKDTRSVSTLILSTCEYMLQLLYGTEYTDLEYSEYLLKHILTVFKKDSERTTKKERKDSERTTK